ncbi:hypothetical protein PGB90_009814 [Kerria lacca]
MIQQKKNVNDCIRKQDCGLEKETTSSESEIYNFVKNCEENTNSCTLTVVNECNEFMSVHHELQEKNEAQSQPFHEFLHQVLPKLAFEDDRLPFGVSEFLSSEAEKSKRSVRI